MTARSGSRGGGGGDGGSDHLFPMHSETRADTLADLSLSPRGARCEIIQRSPIKEDDTRGGKRMRSRACGSAIIEVSKGDRSHEGFPGCVAWEFDSSQLHVRILVCDVDS